MTKQATKYIKENIPYYGKIHTNTKRGKNALAKKAWVITSDFVRMRDFINYGYCVSCRSKIDDWRLSDPAHFHSFGGSGALSGFYLLNMHMSCKYCNGFRGAVAGHEMAIEIVMRYGEDIIKKLNEVRNKTVKADDFWYIAKIEEVYTKFKELKTQYPDFEYPVYL